MGRRWLIEQRASVRMMDERSWASKMGEEDDESGQRWCASFGGSDEDNDESVRMMDESEVRMSVKRQRVEIGL